MCGGGWVGRGGGGGWWVLPEAIPRAAPITEGRLRSSDGASPWARSPCRFPLILGAARGDVINRALRLILLILRYDLLDSVRAARDAPRIVIRSSGDANLAEHRSGARAKSRGGGDARGVHRTLAAVTAPLQPYSKQDYTEQKNVVCRRGHRGARVSRLHVTRASGRAARVRSLEIA